MDLASPAAEKLRALAISLLRPGQAVAVASDASATPGKVLVAVARPAQSWFMTIDATEYDALRLLDLLGLPLPQESAFDRATRTKTHDRR